MAGEADHGLALRGGVIAALKAAPALSARLGDNVFGRATPKSHGWPFARVEIEDAEADEASGWVGEDRRFVVNIFTRPTDAQPDAEAECFRLVNLAKKAITRAPLLLPPQEDEDQPETVILESFFIRSRVNIDAGEAGAYHGRIEFSAKTVE